MVGGVWEGAPAGGLVTEISNSQIFSDDISIRYYLFHKYAIML